ncbi:BCCT transporter family protein, partial [Vibrio parahaemolyticus V-223/04]
ETR